MNLPITHLVETSDFYKDLTEKKVIKIDNSLFLLLDVCDIKGVLGSILKLVKPYESNDLNFGSVVHDAIEFYHSSKSSVEQVKAYTEGLGLFPLLVDETGYKTKEKALELVEAYIKQFEELQPYTIVTNKEDMPLVEIPFEVYLGDIVVENTPIKVYWQGKIDAIVLMNDKVWCLDHKTTKQLGASFRDKYLRTNQFIGYYFALLKVLGRFELDLPSVEGALINALCVRKKGVEIPPPFQLPYFERLLPEWKEDILAKVVRFVKNLHTGLSTNFYLPTRSSCYLFNKCRYWDVCECPSADVRAKMLEGDEFITSNWNPLDT